MRSIGFLIFAAAVFVGVLSSQTRVSRGQSTSASSAAPEAPTFDFVTLKSVIETNHITTIENLIPRLPADLRSNFTLVYKSRSIQDASKDAPRAILFGNDARLVLSYNGSPKEHGFNTIEAMEFNGHRFELRELTFDDHDLPKWSEANPQRCTLCHGLNPRPVWAEYRRWNGVYGSNDDSLPETKAQWLKMGLDTEALPPEHEDFIHFRNLVPHLPRYNSLAWDQRNSCWPYHCEISVDEKTILTSPNFRFTELSIVNNALAIVDRIKGTDHFSKFKYSLARALTCEMPDRESAHVYGTLAIGAEKPKDELWLGSRLAWEKDIATNFAPLNYFGEPFGSTSINLQIDDSGDSYTRFAGGLPRFAGNTNDSTAPARGALTLGGLSTGLGADPTSRSYVALQIVNVIAETDPDLNQLLKPAYGFKKLLGKDADQKMYQASSDFVRYLESTKSVIDVMQGKRICAYLAERSSLEVSKAGARSSGESRISLPLNPGAEILKQSKCIGCHDSPGIAIAPKIPFGRPREFSDYISDKQNIGIDPWALFETVLIGEDASMPYAGARLQEKDAHELIQYLKALSKTR